MVRASASFTLRARNRPGERWLEPLSRIRGRRPADEQRHRSVRRAPSLPCGPERILKYRADRGPVVYAIALFAVHLALWLGATPVVALAAVLPLTLASIFVAAFHHHHQHLNTFRSPVLNRLYDLVLALQTGGPVRLGPTPQPRPPRPLSAEIAHELPSRRVLTSFW